MQYLIRFIISFRLSSNLELKKMDPLTEKKWFLYINDHHEGPLSVSDIHERMKLGSAHQESFVWQEGMPTWQMIKERQEFVIQESSHASNLAQAEKLEATQHEQQVTPNEIIDEKTGDLNPDELNQTRMIGRAALLNSKKEEKSQITPKTRDKKTTKTRKVITLLISATLVISLLGTYRLGYLDPFLEIPIFRATLHKASSLSRPYLIKLTQTIPALEGIIPPLLRLDDVSMIEYEELHTAASETLKEKGPQYALALTQSDPYTPSFYIGSNLPEGSKFDLYVIGLPDTLLNEVSFTGHLSATLEKNLAKTSPLRRSDQKPIARGEYELYLVSSLSQTATTRSIIEAHPAPPVRIPAELPPGARILFVKKYFLGGAKDANYQNKLKDFHSKLKARALTELNEIKQYTSTLDQQLQALIKEAQNMNRLTQTSPKKRKIWDLFSAQWVKIQNEMNQMIQAWTPESLQNEYYYGALYTEVQIVAQSIWKLYEAEVSFMNGQIEQQSFQEQLNTFSNQANEEISRVYNRVKSLELMPSDDSKLPKKL